MKKIFKLLPVALGIVALASCSSDDLFNESASAQAEDLGEATNVVVEDLYSGEVTRSALTAGKVMKWCDNDRFRVYDSELAKFDTYKFTVATKAFSREFASQRVADDKITYAVFPGEKVSWASYDEATEDVKVVMTIPSVITYDGNTEKDFSGTLAYLSNIPMQGPATYDAQYQVHLGSSAQPIQYLTGIVAVTLDNVQTKATWLKLSADKAIAGAFEATLEADAVLKEAAADDVIKTPSKAIYVNIANAPRSRAIVYLPVIADNYTTLKVEYTTEGETETASTIEAKDAASPLTWNVIKDFVADPLVGVDVPRAGSVKNSVLEANYDFQLDTHTPEALTTVLSDRKDVTGTLNLNVDYLQYSTTTADPKWYTIKVPNMKADVVNIKMPNGIDNTTNTQAKLVIADADNAHPYTGKIVLDLTDATTGKLDATNKQDIEVNLTQAEVVFVGDWSNAKNFTLTKSRVLTIGDGKTTTAFNGNVDAKHVVTLKDITTSMTITEAATVTGNLSIPATSVSKKTFDLNINGTVAGQVNAVYATTTVTGLVTSYLYTMGNVTIEQKDGGDAVGTLRLNGDGQNIYLKKGNIGNIDTGVDADSKYTANLYNVETGKTSIGTINPDVKTYAKNATLDANYKMWLKFNGSTWFGEKATKNVATGNIYTASQLAGIDGTYSGGYKLWNDVNLGGKKWLGVAAINMTYAFDGQNFTISNLYLTEDAKDAATTSAARTNDGIGLFKTVAGAVDIKNFILDGVTFQPVVDVTTGTSQKYYKNANIGAVAGIVSAAATFSGIKVQNATFNGSVRKDINAVGGLIGKATAGVIIGGTAANAKNNVAVAITGYHSLGGLIGLFEPTADAKVTIQYYKVVPTFTETNTLVGDEKSNVNFGKIGEFVGSINCTASAVGTVDIKSTNGVISFYVRDHRSDLKFNCHKNYYINGSGNVEEQYFTGATKVLNYENAIGYSVAEAKMQVDGSDYTNAVGVTGGNWVRPLNSSDKSNYWNNFTKTAY